MTQESGSAGILSYGSYVPSYVLRRDQIAAALEERPKPGSRNVSAFDEDTTTMAVEAARQLAGPDALGPLLLATSLPAYSDKTNATAVHAALGLPPQLLAADVAGSVRGGLAALRMGAAMSGLAVLSDMRFGLPGSEDEQEGGDGAAAFRFGHGPDLVAELVVHSSLTAEFLDRWRQPGDIASRLWEERFGIEMYLPLMRQVAQDALRLAGLDKPDYVVTSSPNGKAARAFARGMPAAIEAPDLRDTAGHVGAADVGLLLADVLDRAEPGRSVLVVSGVDGADALVFRTREALARARQPLPVRTQLALRRDVAYFRYLTWRGLLRREPPRRPEPVPPSSPPAARASAWKFALEASQCESCGTVHAPPQIVCRTCTVRGRMKPHPLAGRRARVTTCTVDRLAFSPSPPMLVAVVDFEGGGRLECELADAPPQGLRVGDLVEMTFRRKFTSGGIHNYCWKARPVREAGHGE